MANLIENATGLDGDAGWLRAGFAVTIDGTIEGALGRLVIKSAGGSLVTQNPEAEAGEVIYVSSHHQQGGTLRIRFLNAGGTVVIEDRVVPLVRRGVGVQRRGLLSTFDFSKGSFVAPAGTATFDIYSSGAAGTVRLLQPFASRVGHAGLWQPGPHANPDLDYPAWPTDLPQIMDEGLQLDPIPTRKGFSGDTGWEATRRVTRSRRYRMSGQLALTAEERDRLMQFFDDIDGPFWFTRPDTREVCLAQFLAEGEPVEGGQLPGRRRTQIKLQLRVV